MKNKRLIYDDHHLITFPEKSNRLGIYLFTLYFLGKVDCDFIPEPELLKLKKIHKIPLYLEFRNSDYLEYRINWDLMSMKDKELLSKWCFSWKKEDILTNLKQNQNNLIPENFLDNLILRINENSRENTNLIGLK